MTKYLWKTVIGDFVLDRSFNVIARGKSAELKKKYPDLSSDYGMETERKIMRKLDDSKYHKDLYKENLSLIKKQIRESVSDDNFIIQTIGSIDELDKASNILAKRLREWYELYNPEFSNSISSHEKFTELILKKSKKELLKEIKIDTDDSMGSDLAEVDLNQIKEVAKSLMNLYELRLKHEKYVEKIMGRAAPNVNEITGSMIGARLIAQAGSILRLSEFPASTVQLLGAEKALFRHMKTGARCPKFGVIFMHPLIATAKKDVQGKIARILADKISIAAKVDYFKGDFVGDKLLSQVKKKVKVLTK